MPKKNIEKSPKDVVRVQFDVRRAQLDIIDDLVEDCNLSSKKELFNNAMALMKWAVQETKKGRRVASYHVKDDDVEMVALPALAFIEEPEGHEPASLRSISHEVGEGNKIVKMPKGVKGEFA